MRANGLYITRSLGGLDVPGTKKYYTFDELPDLKIYNTEEDAITYGNPELLAERLKRDKSYNEAYHAKVTSDVKINTEKDKSEVEIAKIKYDAYSNVIKFLISVVTATVTCVTVYNKIQESK